MALAALAACAEEHPTEPRDAAPTAPLPVAAATVGESYAFVINGSSSVSVIRTSDHSVIATVPSGCCGPTSVAVSPDGAFVYVLKFEGTEIGVIETARLLADPTHPASALVGTFDIQIVAPGFRGGDDLLVSANGDFVYVSGAESATSSIVVLRTEKLLADRANALVAKLAIGAYDLNMAISPDGAFIYVTFGRLCCSAAGLAVIRTSDNRRVATVDGVVGSVAVTPNGAYAYVAGAGHSSNQLAVIRTSDNTLANSVVIDGRHTDVAITPDGAYAYVTQVDGGPSSVKVVRISDPAIARPTVVANVGGLGYSLHSVAFTPNGAFAYVTVHDEHRVKVIQTSKVLTDLANAVVATVPVGSLPTQVAIGPALAPTKAPATITLSGLNQAYNGSPKAATATTDPAGLEGVALTYDGSLTPPTAVGSYAVVAALTNPEYEAPDAIGTLVIEKGTATITLGNLAHTFDGTAKAATATTNPAGLSGVTLSYSQNSAAVASPSNAGTYHVLAQLSNPNYNPAEAAGTLTIQPARPTISWADPAAIIVGTPLSGTQLNATATGVGGASLTGSFAYTPAAGTVLGPSPAESLSVAFTLSDPNYTGATKTVHIAVRYSFSGFFHPVDNKPVVNKTNSGQGIPVKFSLAGDQGLDIFQPGSPTSASYSCTANPADVIEQTVAASTSSLSYEAGQYEYVWKTEKAWANSCRRLVLKLKDGTSLEALFQFTK
jgi:DNA-binding beta-propeller fold protein YncE